MIAQLSGKMVEKNPTHLVVDCNGVGYEVNISLHTYSLLPDTELVKLFTFLQVREDAHILWGFASKVEREVFKLLISVSGIGSSTARTMLSSLSPKQVQQAIASEDVASIQSVKGIGAKTAQRVIIELKDKVVKLFDIEEETVGLDNTNKEEALSALEVLGYNRKQAEKACNAVLKEVPNASVEDIIKKALKSL